MSTVASEDQIGLLLLREEGNFVIFALIPREGGKSREGISVKNPTLVGVIDDLMKLFDDEFGPGVMCRPELTQDQFPYDF